MMQRANCRDPCQPRDPSGRSHRWQQRPALRNGIYFALDLPAQYYFLLLRLLAVVKLIVLLVLVVVLSIIAVFSRLALL